MDFYISDIVNYMENIKLNNDVNKMTYLLDKSHKSETLYFGLFIFSTCAGILLCTLKENCNNLLSKLKINNIVENIKKVNLNNNNSNNNNKTEFEIIDNL